MDYTSVSRSLSFGDQERLLYVAYLPPYIYEDGTTTERHSDGTLLGAELGRYGVRHPRVLAQEGRYVLPLSQGGQSLEPGRDKAGMVQRDRE